MLDEGKIGKLQKGKKVEVNNFHRCRIQNIMVFTDTYWTAISTR